MSHRTPPAHARRIERRAAEREQAMIAGNRNTTWTMTQAEARDIIQKAQTEKAEA